MFSDLKNIELYVYKNDNNILLTYYKLNFIRPTRT